MTETTHLLQGVYAITDTCLMPDDTRLQELAEAALRGGLQLLQYRDKSADASKALRQARLLADLCRSYDCLLIINDDPVLARASEAQGVHLGQDDGVLLHARELLGADAIIGRTCHNSLALAQQAAQEGASYLAFGRCYASGTKPHAPATSLDIFKQARTLNLPLVAIGGITPERAPQVIQAGANLVAAVEGIFAAEDPQQAVQDYHRAFFAPSSPLSFLSNEAQHDTLSRTF